MSKFLSANPVLRALALAVLGTLSTAPIAPHYAMAQYYDDGDYGPVDGDNSYASRDYGDRGDTGRDNEQDYWAADNAANDEPDVSFFYDELASDGRWISHRDYGYVWTPSHVDDDWRPYSRGHWVNTDEYGWYWVSDEPWGWATYHYGRWFHDERFGWLWVPGSTWGPAWVAWRSSDAYVGWAPLPPNAYWDGHNGLRYDATLYESPRFAFYWSFIEPRYISTPSIYRYCAPPYRARAIIYSTRPQTRYDYHADHIINRGISVNFFDRFLGSPLRNVRVFASESRNARGLDRRAGDTIRVWRPDFRRQYHAARPQGDRPWGNGVWRNVDRYAARETPAAAPRPRPALQPSIPNKGLPPARREVYPFTPQPQWNRGENRKFGRRPEPAPSRNAIARPTNPAAVPQPPPVVVTTPPPAASPPHVDRGDRGRFWGGGGRPVRGAAPSRPPPVAVTAQPPAASQPRLDRGDRGRFWGGGGRPVRSAAPSRPPPVAVTAQPPATTPPPVAVTPPAGRTPGPAVLIAQPPAGSTQTAPTAASDAPPAAAQQPPPIIPQQRAIPGFSRRPPGVLHGPGRPY